MSAVQLNKDLGSMLMGARGNFQYSSEQEVLRIGCTSTSTCDHGIHFGSLTDKHQACIIDEQSTNSILFHSYQDQIGVWLQSHLKWSAISLEVVPLLFNEINQDS